MKNAIEKTLLAAAFALGAAAVPAAAQVEGGADGTAVESSTGPAAGDERGGEQTIGEQVDDAAVTAKVKAALLGNKATSALRTEVDTADGVVTLSGRAKNEAEKELAGHLASEVKGVKDVNNAISVETND